MIHRALILACLVLAMPCFTRSQHATLRNVSIYSYVAGSKAGKAAAEILISEVKKRTGLNWKINSALIGAGDLIILKTISDTLRFPVDFRNNIKVDQQPEAFRIINKKYRNRNIILVEGFDGRGVLFGIGQLLRMFQYRQATVLLPNEIVVASSPEKSIRGHQLGYRNTANSYDGWTVAQYDQYIRELVIFGANCIEAIPFFSQKPSPHFKVAPAAMNASLSKICDRYDLDFWMWIPAQVDLTDKDKRKSYLDTLDKTLRQCIRVNGLFFPGGDPGDNSPEVVMPLLEDISVMLKTTHPEAKVWLSLQGYNREQSEFVYKYIRDRKPSWLGGLVTGPGSPPVFETRAALPAVYKLRLYPDITHNVRCQFPIPWWDPAFNFTLGREAINPRPYHFGAIYRALQQYIDGFISYSDGIHDDVNKIVWTQLAWNSRSNERAIVKDYAQYFFGLTPSDMVTDAMLALENNWEGPIESNGSITSTLSAWEKLDKLYPALSKNWRWQLCLLRAYYDAYTRMRYLHETSLENKANAILLEYQAKGISKAIDEAIKSLAVTDTNAVVMEWKKKIIDLCASLFQTIALQTSVTKYQASGYERGAVLDFIDRPLNNRWWIEDECIRIRRLPLSEQGHALEVLATWEHPAQGSFYDDVGNISKSPHVLRGESWVTDPLMLKGDNLGFDWWEDGFSRKRLSWMSNMRWPIAMEYNGLDSLSAYTVRITGYGESLLRGNGKRLTHGVYGMGIGEIKEFTVPKDLIRNGKLVLTWDDINEDSLNWRVQSRVTEVWLLKNKN